MIRRMMIIMLIAAQASEIWGVQAGALSDFNALPQILGGCVKSRNRRDLNYTRGKLFKL